MRHMFYLVMRAALSVLLVLAVGMAGLSLWLRVADTALLADSHGSATLTKNAPRDDDLALAERLSRVYRTAARRILPAAVVILADREGGAAVGSHSRYGGCNVHAPAQNRPAQEQAATAPQAKEERYIIGSGFIVDASGIVLTNHHVIEDSRGLVVKMADGRQLPVIAVESDKDLDLAALRVKTDKPLPAAAIGNPDALEVGDMVLTVGAPLEMEQTVSSGIISAKGRTFCPNHGEKLLQTDAAIGLGSSGGPLVNLRGEVVGVATAMLSETDSYSGIGFAVPIDCAKGILERLAKKTEKAEKQAE